jgi:hypothetical protein
MATSEEKFQKLLAAYEDDVQRKQHKMGKRVDPRDQAEPNYASGYCPFLRGGQQVVWAPSFDVIGTFDRASSTWRWGWADDSLPPKVRSRIDAVRKQGEQWGIDVLVADQFVLTGEDQAWNLSVVAVAVASADALHRHDVGNVTRFLALYDAPSPTRSSTSMPAVRGGSVPPSSNPLRALSRSGTHAIVPTPTPPPASVRPLVEAEPTIATRTEIGGALYQCVPANQLGWLGAVTLQSRVVPPMGPLGAVQVELRVTLLATNGAEQPLNPTPALHDAIVMAWQRARERGNAFQTLHARLELTTQGWVTSVQLAP